MTVKNDLIRNVRSFSPKGTTGGLAGHELDGSYHTTVSDVTTLDATASAHGLMPKTDKVKTDATLRPHGIQAAGTLSFNNTSHVLTVAAGTNTYWFQGAKYTTASAITCDIDSYESLTANTLYYFYFDDVSGTLKCSASVWDLKAKVPVATVHWNGSAGAVCKETHNHTRDIDWHINAHLTIGARYQSGLGLTAPTTAADETLQIESGVIYDEDQAISIAQQTTMRGWYKVSASVYTFADYSLPFLGASGDPQWLDTDDYTLKSVGDSDFVVYWVYASPDIDRPLYVIPTHAATAYNTLALARQEALPVLANLNLNPEMKLIYRFIYKGDGQFQEYTDYRIAGSLPSGSSTAISASSVTFSPSGNVAATNVQAAIEELDDEKVAKSLFDANTMLYATADNTPLALTISANTFPARASTGAIAAKSITDFGLSLVDDSDAAAARTTLGLGTMAVETASDYVTKALYDAYTILYADTDNTPAALALSASNLVGRGASGGVAAITIGSSLAFSGAQLRRAALTGDVTASANSNTTAIASGVIVNDDVNASAAIALSKLATQAANTLVGNATAGVAVPTAFAPTGDVGLSGTALTIAAGVVTYAKMQDVSATDRLLGRDSASAGDIEELTVGGGIEFTGAGGIQTSAFTGDATKSAGGTVLTIANDAVTYAKMQNVSATDKVLGRFSAGSGDVEEIACTSAGRALIDDADAAAQRTTLGLGSMATETATNYVAKATYNAYTVLYADTDDTPAALTVAASTVVGRGSTGGIAALTVSAPITISGTAISHSTAAGYIHLPSGGSSNQIVKNSGSAGTGAWGTVTENAGALAAVTTISMSGQLTSTLATGTAPLVVASTTQVANLNVARAGLADTVTVADAAADTTTWPMLATSATGNLAPATDAGLAYNASTNVLTVSGNVIAGAGGGAYGSAATGTLSINVTATKTLTLTSADTYTLTIPATGTAALLATANVFTASQSLTAESAYNPQITLTNAYAGTAAGYLKMQKARGSIASPSAISSGDTLGNIAFYGHDGTNYTIGAYIAVVALAAPSAGVVQGRMVFSPYNSSGAATEVLRLSATEARFNEGGVSTVDFYVESDNYDAIKVVASGDNLTLMSNALGKIALYGGTPRAQATICPTPLTGVAFPVPTYTAPGTPDTTWGGGTLGGYGWATADEWRSACKLLTDLANEMNKINTALGTTSGISLMTGGL